MASYYPRPIALFLLTVIAFALTGCAHRQSSSVQRGTAAGAVTGGVLGGVIGNNVGDGDNEILGAALGSVAGGAIGNRIASRQAQTQQQIQAAQSAANTRVVNVSNANGSFTPVTLIHVGNGQWQGPRGEIYSNLPTETQLRQIYGI